MRPDIYVPTNLGRFQVLDFRKYREILAAAEPAKAALKCQLARAIGAEVLAEASAPSEPAKVVAEPRRRLLRRRRGAAE